MAGRYVLLREAMERQGNWLFRWRSVLPLLVAPIGVLAASQFEPWPATADLAWAGGCLLVSLSGLAVRVWTKGYAPARTSGRNTRKGQVADTLNTSGPYSIVRNPLYVGNFLMALGAVLLLRSIWFTALFAIAFAFYYERIVFAEEEFLRRKFGERYERWAVRTPMYVPRLRDWQAPPTPFRLRRAIRKEYLCFCILLLVFCAAGIGRRVIAERQIVVEPVWVGVGAAGILTLAITRFLAKRTRLLHSRRAEAEQRRGASS